MQKTIPPENFRRGLITLAGGQEISITQLLGAIVGLGYENATVVQAPGAFSRRGGIVDIWPPADAFPARLEFVGNEIESIRRFDPETQRSRESVTLLTLALASEADFTLAKQVAETVAQWDLSNCQPVAEMQWKQDAARLTEGTRWRGVEYYLQSFYPRPATLIEHLASDGLLVIEDWDEIEATAIQLAHQAEDVRVDLESQKEIPLGLGLAGRRPYVEWDTIREQILTRPRVLFDYQALGQEHKLPFVVGERFGGQLRKVVDFVAERRAENARLVVVSRQSERLAELLRERNIFAKPHDAPEQAPPAGSVTLVQGSLAEGWKLEVRREPRVELVTSNLYILTDAEIFGWSRPKPRRLAARAARPISPEAFLSDLGSGDYVVHIDHGIGLFRGLVRMSATGTEREFLQIEYAQGDQLYLPVHQMDRISRYVAPGGLTPPLHRLGTADWAQVKERTQQAVQDIARELLELYATREVITGHAFNPDTTWQHELEASFPYVETEDQLRAIAQVKRDMEETRPMDRLIVGDVGYGKTEIALRAAFKAVMDGKQVAVLVPTTVLAQQHFNTFRERLSPFPVEIEMLSRFRTDAEQDKILEKLREGRMDIVVGTHRLLSSDVKFRDLGLLIIDEEQRFGVTHKEKLKQWRSSVDVLTLTATPIPRTLYMSLTGARDMSTIETPPEERLPIRTVVAGWDNRVVRDAILRELDRGGQVFVVHNRVQGIGILTEQLRKLVPEASIVIGHGQMNEEQLESVMSDFAAGRYDVLVCTTIIESGIDIPNANTIIVNHADKFGLAQLYQLRGRVGRSAARAYAYFLHSKDSRLGEEARSRLQTLAEASELGAGFQIALRDMEIRGAGDILGARQSGHIAAVGFDLYCRLLARAIEQQRENTPNGRGAGEGVTPSLKALSPTIDLPVQAEIPEGYIADGALRLRLYRRLADVTEPEQADEIESEFRDRFGELPEPMRNLFFLLRLKVNAREARAAAITLENGRILIRFTNEDETRTARLTKRFGTRIRIARDRVWLAGMKEDSQWREHLMSVLETVRPDGKGPGPRASSNGN